MGSSLHSCVEGGFVSARSLRSSFTVIFLGFFMLAGPLWGEDRADPIEEAQKLYMQWLDPFWAGLEHSDTTQFRAASAIRLIQTDEPAAVERAKQLLQDILDSPEPDAVSLWIIASACPWLEEAEWCESGRAHEMLKLADPDNAAAILLQFSQIRSEQDENLAKTEAREQMFIQAAEAARFDSFWGRGAVGFFQTALDYIDKNPFPEGIKIGSVYSQSDSTDTQLALGVFLGLWIYTPSATYQNLTKYCMGRARDRHTEGVTACRNLARLMRNSGYTSLTRSLGYHIDKEMLRAANPQDPEILSWELRKQVFKIAQMCHMSPWQLDSDLEVKTDAATVLNWLNNLEKSGEWEGFRLSSRQEYEIAPEKYLYDPRKCDRLQTLDNENIITLLDGQTPDEAWQRMKADD
jgi:hypothetical protein